MSLGFLFNKSRKCLFIKRLKTLMWPWMLITNWYLMWRTCVCQVGNTDTAALVGTCHLLWRLCWRVGHSCFLFRNSFCVFQPEKGTKQKGNSSSSSRVLPDVTIIKHQEADTEKTHTKTHTCLLYTHNVHVCIYVCMCVCEYINTTLMLSLFSHRK